jgi:hypothetical protein
MASSDSKAVEKKNHGHKCENLLLGVCEVMDTSRIDNPTTY